jgi:hypothetical protein
MSSTLDAARRGALATEYRAVFGYGLLGAKLAARWQPTAQAFLTAHEALCVDLRDGLSAPPAAQPDYPDMYPVTSSADALRLAVSLEEASAAGWRYLYAIAAGPRAVGAAERAQAQAALSAAAVRATTWRVVAGSAQPTVAFPGL